LSQSFVHCHVHSEYSLLDGASRTSDLVRRAAALEMPALALTDHGVMYGSIEFYKEAKGAGIKPLIGMEAYVATGSRTDRTPSAEGKPYGHLVLLARDAEGYRNLARLNTAGHLEGFYHKPRIDREILRERSAGLIALTACMGGEIPKLIRQGKFDQAEESARWYQETFGEHFYLELQDHGFAEQRQVNRALVELGERLGIELVATNDSHFTHPDDMRSHQALLCIQTGKSLLDPNRRLLYGPEYYLKSAAQMAEIFRDHPRALANTLAIAEKCDVKFEFGKSILPHFPVPEGHTPESYLRDLAHRGARERYGDSVPAEILERLEFELGIVIQMGFASYFLIVWDFIHFAKSSQIQVGPGRGSAAGSLVAYCLRITNIDPVKYGLLFERFLNPERVSMPDVDIDFCIDRRGEVIQYVTEKYGRDKVSQIITYGTLGAKAAIKDIGRVLELNFNDTNRLTKMVPEELNITLAAATAEGTELAREAEREPKVAEILELGRKLEGMVRNTSIHAAGVIIARDPLADMVPLQRVGKDDEGVSTQFEQKYCEMLGLLKMDFLGLRNLTMLSRAIEHIERRHGFRFDLNSQDFTDPKVYQFLQTGATVGVFQIESEGMTKLVRKLKPTSFEDISAILALYRPGPLQSGYVDEYVARKHGKSPIEYPHPDLIPILQDTYGTMVYQEQIMQIAQVMAGYSLGQADLLRRAMGKKKKEEMDQQRSVFLAGTRERNISDEIANDLFDKMTKFSEYCFNRAHTAAYAVVTYQTAYLKCHYPAEYMAALMSSLLSSQDKILLCLQDCRRMGIAVLPPDVNTSGADFTPTDEGIRFGLGAIKNVGLAAIDAIVEAREKLDGKRFRDLFEFCAKVDLKQVNRRCIESLIRAGALDSLGGHRAQYFAALDAALESAQRQQRDEAVGQFSLFGAVSGPALVERPSLPDVPPIPVEEQLASEKELLGFYVSGHPLRQVPVKLDWHVTNTLSQVASLGDNKPVVVGGLLTQVRKLVTKSGNQMLAARLEDFTDQVDIVAFPEAFEQHGQHLFEEAKILIKGKVSLRDERLQIMVSQVWPLEAMPSLHLHLAPGTPGQQLALVSQSLRQHPGTLPVIFHFDHAGEQVVAAEGFWVSRDETLEQTLQKLLGTERVRWFEPPPRLMLA